MGANFQTGEITIPLPKDIREEGRQEMLAEIAKMEPMIDFDERGVGQCYFCREPFNHTSDCLWLRARQSVGEQG